MKMIKLPKCKNISINNEIKSIDTKIVYLKINEKYDLKIKKGDHVLKNMVLAVSETEPSIVSSISGTIVDINKYIIIENDYKEEFEKITIENIDKKQFISLLKDSGIKGMGGAGFPTYKKYMANNIKYLLVNAVECEPYITADYMVETNYINEIIDAITKIMTINRIEKCIIGVKEGNIIFDDQLKDKQKISVVKVKDFYPAGWERILIKNTLNETYDKIPIEKGIVVNNISTIYAMGELLKGNRLTSRIVTVTGNIEKCSNYNLKIGTKISDIIESLKLPNHLKIVVGGPMMGESFNDDIIDATTNCILVLDELKDIPIPCLRCGKCSEVCPRNLEPVLIKDYLKNSDMLADLEPNRCIECGLCSYICPSKIDVREKVKEAKRMVK